MMKEYKRCKYCNMEMLKNEFKCPHCGRLQTFFYINKSQSLSRPVKSKNTYENRQKTIRNTNTQNTTKSNTYNKKAEKNIFSSAIPKILIIFVVIFMLFGFIFGFISNLLTGFNINSSIGNFLEDITSTYEEEFYENPEFEAEDLAYEFTYNRDDFVQEYEGQYITVNGIIKGVTLIDDENYYEIKNEHSVKILIPIYDYYEEPFSHEYRYDNIDSSFTYNGDIYTGTTDNGEEYILLENGDFKY